MVNSLQVYSAQASDLAPCFGDLRKSENNSEINPKKIKV